MSKMQLKKEQDRTEQYTYATYKINSYLWNYLQIKNLSRICNRELWLQLYYK